VSVTYIFLMRVRVQRECAKHRSRIRNSHCRSAAMTPSAPVAAKPLRSVVIIYQWWSSISGDHLLVVIIYQWWSSISGDHLSVVISVYWADY